MTNQTVAQHLKNQSEQVSELISSVQTLTRLTEKNMEVISGTRHMVGVNTIAIMMIAKTIGVDPIRLMDDASALIEDEKAFREVFREFEQ
jgi:predicted regulator of amino acid metabolism with ACT domain